MAVNSGDISSVLISLKPNLILCKCVGVCSLSNLFGSSHVNSLSCNILSLATIYQLVFVLYYEVSYPVGLLALFRHNKFHVFTLLSLFLLVMFIDCIFSDKKLLKLLKNIDAVDTQMKNLLPTKSEVLGNIKAYKFLVGLFTFDAFLFFDRECNWNFEHCLTRTNVLSLIHHHIPFLSVISLFCATTFELVTRFKALQKILNNHQERLNDPLFLEECRHFHSLLLMSTDIFLDWISFRLTNHFLILTLHTVCQLCFPCFYGEGCLISSVAVRVVQQVVLVYIMCYCASKLNEKSEEILNEVQLVPLGKCPYNCKDQIEVFVDQILASPLKVSAIGLFDVDMTTIPSVLSVILMYTVVVAQLADRLETYFVLH